MQDAEYPHFLPIVNDFVDRDEWKWRKDNFSRV